MAITLTAGMRNNLIALQNTNKLMESTQTKLATGMKVNSALDDPVNFFKAKSHRDRAGDLSALKDGMSEGIKTIEAANTGIESMYDMLAQMKSLAQASKTSDDPAALGAQFNELAAQVVSLAEDASYGGNNLLNGSTDGENDEISVAFNESTTAPATLSVAGINVQMNTNGELTIQTLGTDGSLTALDSSTNTISMADTNFTNASAVIQSIDTAIGALRTTAQRLASSLSTIDIRSEFTSQMINTLETGADTLTLADMNEEGANMLMLQTRQSLGTTSLSLSSQAAQSVLRMF